MCIVWVNFQELKILQIGIKVYLRYANGLFSISFKGGPYSFRKTKIDRRYVKYML